MMCHIILSDDGEKNNDHVNRIRNKTIVSGLSSSYHKVFTVSYYLLSNGIRCIFINGS